MSFKKTIRKAAPKVLMEYYHWLWAFCGAVVFGFPSKKMTVIGVTGTSGKSTTVDFVTRILEEAGHKVVSNSSIRFKVAGKEWKNERKMGMPGRFFMQQLLAQGVEAGCDYAVLEVTSEGIKQHRHKFIYFDVAVFTNLSKEHIESHGSFENYRTEKLKLFQATPKIHVINIDDENSKYFLDVPAEETIGFKFKTQNAKVKTTVQNSKLIEAEDVVQENGLSFRVQGTEFKIPLLGEFNVYNALAAITVVQSQDIPLDVAAKALAKVTGIPGRMEMVAKDPFLVVVDYAHTPTQLEQAYQSLAPRPLVCVISSCGGGRDKWKRPVLGEIAQKYCKEIVITNEDPYDEDPLEIMEQIANGIDEGTTYSIVPDRKEAIKKAFALAKPGDAVLLAGKGSESVMMLANGKKIPWDDREAAREALKHP